MRSLYISEDLKYCELRAESRLLIAVRHPSFLPPLHQSLPPDDFSTPVRFCAKLAEALQMLPTSSSLLHTLELVLDMRFSQDTFPYSAYPDLIETINVIYLPVLATVKLCVDMHCEGDDELEADSDFSPFLRAHPNLVDLALRARGTNLSDDNTFLPRLHSFTGSFSDSVAICSRPRNLEKLSITHIPAERPFHFNPVPLAIHWGLREFRLVALHAGEVPMKVRRDLSPESLTQLASSFPNLTYLDTCINRPLVSPLYRINLPSLF